MKKERSSENCFLENPGWWKRVNNAGGRRLRAARGKPNWPENHRAEMSGQNLHCYTTGLRRPIWSVKLAHNQSGLFPSTGIFVIVEAEAKQGGTAGKTPVPGNNTRAGEFFNSWDNVE